MTKRYIHSCQLFKSCRAMLVIFLIASSICLTIVRSDDKPLIVEVKEINDTSITFKVSGDDEVRGAKVKNIHVNITTERDLRFGIEYSGRMI